MEYDRRHLTEEIKAPSDIEAIINSLPPQIFILILILLIWGLLKCVM